MSTQIETVIVGGGQAGLAVSYYLRQQNRPHIVLEQADGPANAWRNHRWDSFTLNTPNWQSALPGAEIPGSSPDGFLSREEIVAYFENYVSRFQLPVNYGVQVRTIRPKFCGRGYVLETNAGRFGAVNVVIATGLFQKPKMPAVSADFPREIKQIHSDKYRNPQSLRDGAILVVGSGQSGAQIAEELYQCGRRVYLSVSRAARVPRRYRGSDANWWHERMGDYERTVDQLPSPQAKFASKPMISGKDGGHTLNLHQLAHDGVTLLGRIRGVRGHSILLAQDLKANLARADQFEADFVKKIDEFIIKNGIDAPEETLASLKDGYEAPEKSKLSLMDAGIRTVIWATGYSFDFSLVQLPVFDGDGYPIQKRGVTDYPGLYFVGLPWLHNARSGLLFGLAQDAEYIAAAIRLYTVNAARLISESDRLGTLEPGRRADVVTRRRDPISVPVDKVRSLRRTFTIVGRHIIPAEASRTKPRLRLVDSNERRPEADDRSRHCTPNPRIGRPIGESSASRKHSASTAEKYVLARAERPAFKSRTTAMVAIGCAR